MTVPVPKKGVTPISIRLADELTGVLDADAAKNFRSRSAQVNWIVDNYLRSLETIKPAYWVDGDTVHIRGPFITGPTINATVDGSTVLESEDSPVRDPDLLYGADDEPLFIGDFVQHDNLHAPYHIVALDKKHGQVRLDIPGVDLTWYNAHRCSHVEEMGS